MSWSISLFFIHRSVLRDDWRWISLWMCVPFTSIRTYNSSVSNLTESVQSNKERSLFVFIWTLLSFKFKWFKYAQNVVNHESGYILIDLHRTYYVPYLLCYDVRWCIQFILKLPNARHTYGIVQIPYDALHLFDKYLLFWFQCWTLNIVTPRWHLALNRTRFIMGRLII